MHSSLAFDSAHAQAPIGVINWVENHKMLMLEVAVGAAVVAVGGIKAMGVMAEAGKEELTGEALEASNLSAKTEIRAMSTRDLRGFRALAEKTEGLAFRPEETNFALKRALSTNPGLSQVAVKGHRVVGGVFIGETGLRGMINHLAVDPLERGAGLGTKLVQAGLKEMYETTPVRRVYASVLSDNKVAMKFWSSLGRRATANGEGGEVVTYILDLDSQPWLN